MAGLAIYRWRSDSLPVIIIIGAQPHCPRQSSPRFNQWQRQIRGHYTTDSTVRTLLIQSQYRNQVTYRMTSTRPHLKKKVNRSLKKWNSRTTLPILRAVSTPFSAARRRISTMTESSLPLWARGTGAKSKRVRKSAKQKRGSNLQARFGNKRRYGVCMLVE